jgi:hypothetical protein
VQAVFAEAAGAVAKRSLTMEIEQTTCSATFVAFDAEDALAVWCEHTGNKPSDHEEPFELVPDDKIITITDENHVKGTNTAAGWASKGGRGFLCSTDW